MVLSSSIVISWCAFIFICYYFIRPLHNILIRTLLTILPCLFLISITCANLPRFYASTLVTVAVCWLTTTRLVHVILLTRTRSVTLQSFLSTILWTFFPIRTRKTAKNQWPIILQLILILMKLLTNHWIYRWSLSCGTHFSYERVFMFYAFLVTISCFLDMQTVCLRIITREKYTMESFTNFPVISLSLREFWGQRYNQIVNTILKESIFEPIRVELSSSTMGALITFIISGLFHVHLAFVTFGDLSSLFPAFLFFFLHGLACCFEAHVKIQFAEHVRWVITHTFLLMTAPLIIRPFIEDGSPFLMLNPPPLINIEWIPKLPLPSFCLR